MTDPFSKAGRCARACIVALFLGAAACGTASGDADNTAFAARTTVENQIAAQNQIAAAPAAAPNAGQGVADPAAFVRETYARYLPDGGGEPPEYPTHAYSPRLRALFAQDERNAGGEVGALDFDYWIVGQDYQLGPIAVTAEPSQGDPTRTTIVARFENFGEPAVNRFDFVRIDGRWFLDDVRNEAVAGRNETGWTLSRILADSEPQ